MKEPSKSIQFVTRVAFEKADRLTAAAIGITSKARQTFAVGVVRVGNADGICGAAVDAVVVAGVRCKTGPAHSTRVHPQFDRKGCPQKTDQKKTTLHDLVFHDAKGVFATVKVCAAVNAVTNARRTSQTGVRWVKTVDVSVAHSQFDFAGHR